MATKIRALYQRSKGRDLFDLWLALVELGIPAHEIHAAFEPYRPSGLTSARAIANLNAKLHDPGFTSDLDRLLVRVPQGYSTDGAGALIVERLLARLA